jgi:hypothetical protein
MIDSIFSFFNENFKNSIEFLKGNFNNILIVVWVIILIVIFINVYNLDFSNNDKKEVTKITVEEMARYIPRDQLIEKPDKEVSNNLDNCIWSKNKNNTFMVESSVDKTYERDLNKYGQMEKKYYNK